MMKPWTWQTEYSWGGFDRMLAEVARRFSTPTSLAVIHANTRTPLACAEFQCACGRADRLGDALLECYCGAHFYAEWSGDDCRVVGTATMPAS